MHRQPIRKADHKRKGDVTLAKSQRHAFRIMSSPFGFGRRQSLTVADILKAREHPVTTIKPTETVGELARQLQRLRIGAMIVSGDGETVDGIISERDVAYGLALYRGDLHTLPVSQLMTKQVVTCEPEDKVAEIARIMSERRIRHMPVKEEGRLVGVLSIRDVTMHRIEELQRLFRLIQTRLK